MISPAELKFIELPRSSQENIFVEQAAILVLQTLYDKPNPNAEDLDTMVAEMDDSITLAAIDHNDMVVGTGALQFFENPNTEIIAAIVNVVTVATERRKGVATKIVSLLGQEADKLEAREVIVIPEAEAVGLYEGLGYQYRQSHKDKDIYVKPLAAAASPPAESAI